EPLSPPDRHRPGTHDSYPSRLRVPLQPQQIGPHLQGALITQVAVFLQSLGDDVFQLWRKVRVQADCGIGSRSRLSWKMTPELSPRKGNAPVAISYSTAPKENKSLRASNSFALTCGIGPE